MKSRELRIGNYVADRGGKTLRIDWFEREKVCCERITINGIQLHPLTERFEFCKPIELTKELLKKCSTRCYNSFFFDKKYDFYILESGGVFSLKIGGILICQIKYLHQLQNLYFALTNQELKIEL